MNDITEYLRMREEIRPADIIIVSGRAVISGIIKLMSGSKFSHVGIIRQGFNHIDNTDVMMFNSTIDHDKNGCQTYPLGETLYNYESGTLAYHLYLKEDIRKNIYWEGFYKSIGEIDGIVKYNTPGLFGFLGRMIPIIGPHIDQKENHKSMV